MRSFAGIDAGIARAEAQRLDDGSEVRLRRQAAHRIDRAIDGVGARIDRREHARRRDAARVVRVEVHRQADLVLQRLHQRVGGARAGTVRPCP